MLGLFMVLPLLATYGANYTDSTPALLGLAVGIYGLSQAVLQILYGAASDILGRKRVIAFGLLVFVVGSLLAGLATSIEGLIIGRALQGAGAVASAITALLADQTRDSNRTFAMAIVGASIGLSFIVSILLGPFLADIVGLSGVFYTAAALGLVAIGLLYVWIPAEAAERINSKPSIAEFSQVFKMADLWRLDFGIFALHATLTGLFVVIPLVAGSDLTQVYLYMVLGGVLLAVPAIGLAEAKQLTKPVFMVAIAGLLAACVVMWFGWLPVGHWFALALFFGSFMVLESMLPSIISRIAPAKVKGAALGVYSTGQFLGAFIGATVSGFLYQHYSASAAFGFFGGLLLLWMVISIGLSIPKRTRGRGTEAA